MYVKHQGNAHVLIVALYMDDLVYARSDKSMMKEFKIEMMKRYEMSDLGLLHHFLGIEIHQEDDGVFICQRKCAEKILKKFGMDDCKPVDTPLMVSKKLKKENGGRKVNESMYRSLIVNLLYLTA